MWGVGLAIDASQPQCPVIAIVLFRVPHHARGDFPRQWIAKSDRDDRRDDRRNRCRSDIPEAQPEWRHRLFIHVFHITVAISPHASSPDLNGKTAQTEYKNLRKSIRFSAERRNECSDMPSRQHSLPALQSRDAPQRECGDIFTLKYVLDKEIFCDESTQWVVLGSVIFFRTTFCH